MPNPQQIADDTQKLVDQFSNAIDPIQKALYNKITLLLKSLDVDSNGNVKMTVYNLNTLNKVKLELQGVINNPKFKNVVADISSDLDDINQMQQNYFTDVFKEKQIPPSIIKLKSIVFKETVENLTGAGMKDNVINEAADIVKNGITENQSFGDMQAQIREFILGNKDVDGKLVSYVKQIIGDTYHTQSRIYNQTMVEDLDLEWFQYVGSTKDTSRPICIALVAKEWIHKSELGAIAQGHVNGKDISTKGMYPDTNAENIIARCGGYNCNHHMIPVPKEAVPTKVVKKITGEKDLSEERPKFKK